MKASDDLVTVAFKACTALDEVGIRAILVGGSAATFYAPKAYQSRDVDLIASFSVRRDQITAALSGIGYVRQGRIFAHPDQVVTIDIPDDTVLIGEEFVGDFRTYQRDGWLLNVITPFDSIRDRLLWFFHYNDRSALAAAVAVFQVEDVDLEALREWSGRERMQAKFGEFLSRLSVEP